MAEIELRPLPPEEAIAYFRAKGYEIGFDWRDVWREEHVRAFTVAKAMAPEILQTIREALDRAIAEGSTIDRFVRELRPLLEAQGWWGRRNMVDPLTGEEREVQLGSPRRLQVIYETNLRMAYQAGRWERIQATKGALPYLRYTAVMDGRTRPQHRAWHGTVLPADDPWWDTHYPPCGFRCRCTVIQLNERTLKRRGWSVTGRPAAFEQVPFTNPRTGERGTVERGIDPGFDYNVGKAYLRSLSPRPVPGIEGKATHAAADQADRAGAVAAFLEEFQLEEGETRIHVDQLGFGLAVGPGLFLDASGEPAEMQAELAGRLPEVARALRSPREIRTAWDQGEDGRPILVRRYFGEGVAVDLFARSWRVWTSPAVVARLETVGVRAWPPVV